MREYQVAVWRSGGATENAGVENAGALKMQGVENAGVFAKDTCSAALVGASRQTSSKIWRSDSSSSAAGCTLFSGC